MTEKEITDFIYREAYLLDSMQWDAWLDLFHPEGRYWMPLEWQQSKATTSLRAGMALKASEMVSL